MQDQLLTTRPQLAFVHHNEPAIRAHIMALQALITTVRDHWIASVLVALTILVEPNVARLIANHALPVSDGERCLHGATCLECARAARQPPPKGA